MIDLPASIAIVGTALIEIDYNGISICDLWPAEYRRSFEDAGQYREWALNNYCCKDMDELNEDCPSVVMSINDAVEQDEEVHLFYLDHHDHTAAAIIERMNFYII